AQPRQHLAEFEHAAELRAVARLAIVGVIAVLLASGRVRAGRLDVAVGIRADPHLGPRRRNGEAVQALSRCRVLDALAIGRVVGPDGAGALAPDAADAVGDVAQAGVVRALAIGGVRAPHATF